jgi:nitroreductase
MPEAGLFDTINTARALRRYKPETIPNEVLTKILDAAIRAPSGSNQQNWIFVVVKDAEKRKKIGEIYKKAGAILMKLYATRSRPEHMDDKQYETLMKSATYLIDHMGDAPVLLFACMKNEGGGAPPANLPADVAAAMRTMVRIGGSSIYPAVQNIILACRAFGIGTVLTTIHVFYEEEVKALLGLPAEVSTYALMPMGYPINKFGPVRRRPVSEVAFLDSYGHHWKG